MVSLLPQSSHLTVVLLTEGFESLDFPQPLLTFCAKQLLLSSPFPFLHLQLIFQLSHSHPQFPCLLQTLAACLHSCAQIFAVQLCGCVQVCAVCLCGYVQVCAVCLCGCVQVCAVCLCGCVQVCAVCLCGCVQVCAVCLCGCLHTVASLITSAG